MFACHLLLAHIWFFFDQPASLDSIYPGNVFEIAAAARMAAPDSTAT